MKKLLLAVLPLITLTACNSGTVDKAFSFVQVVDKQSAEFYSAIDLIIVATIGFIGLVHSFFG